MRKDLKLNLIFFGVLLVLLAPGFIILMNKKLKGTTDPNYMPHDVPTSIAYNQPPPVPPRLPRVEPAEVRHWVTKLLQDRAGVTALMARSQEGSLPVMGDAFRTQLLTVSPAVDGIVHAHLLLWDERTDVRAGNPAVTAFMTNGTAPLTDYTVEQAEVPKVVRHALQRVGYTAPPNIVWVISGKFPAPTGDARLTALQIGFQGEDKVELVSVVSR